MDRRYETICIIKADIGEAEIKAIVTKSKDLVVREAGTVNTVDEWGRRRLAYPIQKKHEGYYVLFDYNSSPAGSKELERSLKINENVVRQQTVKLDTTYVAPPAPAAEPVEEPAKADAAKEPVKADAAKEPVKADAAKEPVKADAAKELVKADAAKELVKADAAKETKEETPAPTCEAPVTEPAKETDKTEEGGADG